MFGKSLGKGKNRRTQAQGPWWSQSKKLLIRLLLITILVAITLVGYMTQVNYELFKYLRNLKLTSLLDPESKVNHNPVTLYDIFNLKGFWIFNDLGYSGSIMIFWIVFVSIGLSAVWYRIFRSYITYNSYEYGNESFENNSLVVKQYTNIPDRNKSFPGYGGIPVLHKNKFWGKLMQIYTYILAPKIKQSNENLDKVPGIPGINIQKRVQYSFQKIKFLGKYMIDQATNNTLIYGITRSGKGETFVFPLIDILSRAMKKVSIFVNDPKGELARSSYFTLIRRGYKVVIIDLSNMYKSASYNPLQVIIDYARKGYTDQVQMEVNKISTSIYQTKQSGNSDPFWANSSSNLLNALILAQIDLARRNNDWSKVTFFNVYQMLTQMAGKEVVVDSDERITDDVQNGTKKSMLTHYFNLMAQAPHDPYRQMAMDAFSQSSFAGSETQGSIFSSMMEGIKIYQQQDVAKLTSKNTVDFKESAFPRRFSLKLMDTLQLKTANVTFRDASGHLIESRKQDIDNLGYLNYALKAKLPRNFEITINVENHVYVFTGSIVRKQKVFGNPFKADVKVARQNIRILKNKKLKFIETKSTDNNYSDVQLKYSEQPVAVFFVTPPNNDAYNQIVSFAIDQSFNQMYEMATQNGGKCFRRVHYVLDEFGNLPTVNSMNTKISIGLGQEILFDIVVQNDEQLSDKYDDKVANTIKANCSNTLYILSNDDKTTELISKKLGKTTVMTRNHSITPDLNIGRDTLNTNQTAQDIMSSVELQHLMVGQQVLLRANTRQSIYGNKIRNNPIFANGLKYEMPSRWQFLQDTFDTSTIMSDIPLKCIHSKMSLKDNAYNYFNNGMNVSDNTELDKMNNLAGLSNSSTKISSSEKEIIKQVINEDDIRNAQEIENTYVDPLFTDEEISDESFLNKQLPKILNISKKQSSEGEEINEFLNSKTAIERINFIKNHNDQDFWNIFGITRENLDLD
ncbi:VirD4-like conjugal transfer protein, CD1115 family [Fructilactobacillus cliffordii]|uniref:Type IV secretory system conjugative DNA transfer family protein n=1 Tax=Fructilactobacillus cliffordii TaxID=2940299 RepID=A0A9Q8ZUT3_9LACO|nr:type IV secretory system conjugative DNA transfer family protein [Fructilactobacillus cliffordii]USS89999.1 type IV secretory system conjugative DNA transfer family protein [Fructilactobacillus cliffordii]